MLTTTIQILQDLGGYIHVKYEILEEGHCEETLVFTHLCQVCVNTYTVDIDLPTQSYKKACVSHLGCRCTISIRELLP